MVCNHHHLCLLVISLLPRLPVSSAVLSGAREIAEGLGSKGCGDLTHRAAMGRHQSCFVDGAGEIVCFWFTHPVEPLLVPERLRGPGVATAIAVSDSQVCVILAEGRKLRCWGDRRAPDQPSEAADAEFAGICSGWHHT